MRFADGWTIFRTFVATLAVLICYPHAHASDLPTNIYISICGDGIVQIGEVCDLGVSGNTGAYGSSDATKVCAPGCLSYGPYCGDGILQARFGEECDDGNNVSGDLCSATCKAETPTPPSSGAPPQGSIPPSSAPPGNIPSSIPTEVVLRGKAYPNASIDILLDGTKLASTQADSNADFLYTSTSITPGTATFSFLATDNKGVQSITSSETFNVVQSAVTTVNNIFIPPTVSVSATQLAPGALLSLFGQSVPGASVVTQLSDSATSSLAALTDSSGNWALQVDTGSLTNGYHSAKSYFQISNTIKSGFGKAVNFYVGNGTPSCGSSTDLNGDKKVNLVDFSIFLTHWGTSDKQGDFNCDGTVNLADFSILLFNWTG
jgi:cysteine-rich repeat protein